MYANTMCQKTLKHTFDFIFHIYSHDYQAQEWNNEKLAMRTMWKECEGKTKISIVNDWLLSRRGYRSILSTNHVVNIQFIEYNLFIGNNNTGHRGDDVIKQHQQQRQQML